MARQNNFDDRGFTLSEMLVSLVISGLLMAIASPSFIAFQRTQTLNTARSEALDVMREAQAKAIQHRRKWQASFRVKEGWVQWATHPAGMLPSDGVWKNFPLGVQLDAETTLSKSGEIRRIQFNHLGQVNGQLGRLTFSMPNGGSTKRCVIVSTLLGALRTGENHRTLDNGKSCW